METNMKLHRISGLGCLVCVLSSGAAFADACSGRDHTTGTVLGAVGGAAIGGAASNNAGGAVAGAVVGGLAGNAIARAQDCDRSDNRGERGAYRDRGGDDRGGVSVYVQPAYGGPQEDQYWRVQSYDDFSNDYRHIWTQIRRGRDEGSLSRGDAERYLARLQRIRERADFQQRAGRFDPGETEDQLRDLRRTIRYARREGSDDDRPYRR
jgi:hypothetical protein